MTNQSALGGNIPPAIATIGLAKRYQHQFAIKALNLTVPSGTVLGILGANGSGKSSLIKLLATAEVPTRGQIYFHGDRLVKNSSQLRLRKQIGYLPEREEFDSALSVTDYLSYFASLYQIPFAQTKIRVYEVLDCVGLAHQHHNLIGNLSQGEQKRLSLARAIIHEPTILLLDNPFPGLDKPAQDNLYNLLATLKEAGMTIIISATSLTKLVKICTMINVIEYGYLTGSIDPQKLKFRDGHLAQLDLDHLQLDPEIAKLVSFLDNPSTNLQQEI